MRTHMPGGPLLSSHMGGVGGFWRRPSRRAAPAVLYLPHLQLWWETASPVLRATLWMLLADLPPELPLLLLATAEAEAASLEPEVLRLFR